MARILVLIWVQNFTEVLDRKIKAFVVFTWVQPITTSVTQGIAFWVSFSSSVEWESACLSGLLWESNGSGRLWSKWCTHRRPWSAVVTKCSGVAESWVRFPHMSASFGTTVTDDLSKTWARWLPQQSLSAILRGNAQIQFLEKQLAKHKIPRWKGSLSRMMQH